MVSQSWEHDDINKVYCGWVSEFDLEKVMVDSLKEYLTAQAVRKNKIIFSQAHS